MRNLVTLVLALGLLGVATVARADKYYYQIQNAGSGKCLQPIALEDGAPIIQTTCNDSPIQWWVFSATTPPAPPIFRLYNVGSARCLDASGGANDHTPIDLWPCNWISNERWDSPAPNHTQLRSRVSGTRSHCLDVPGATSVDVWLQLYRCNGTDAQNWIFIEHFILE
jgi:hypothetical protein